MADTQNRKMTEDEFYREYEWLADEYERKFGEPVGWWDRPNDEEVLRILREALRTGKTIWEIQTENLPPDTIL